ncbi:MAG: hypothetical protein ACK4HJ_21125 [Acidovorax sp.]
MASHSKERQEVIEAKRNTRERDGYTEIIGASGGATPYPEFWTGANPPDRTPIEAELDRIMNAARLHWSHS